MGRQGGAPRCFNVLSQGPPTKEWAWRLRTKSSTRSASCGYRLGECHGWKISPEDLKISNRLAQTNVLSILATAYRSFRQTTERKSERRSDRRYDKAHYLFHAVVGWVSCSGVELTAVRWGAGLAEGGRRWAGLGVGRSARAGVVWSGGNRADMQGWTWSVRAGPDMRPKLHRVRAVVGRVGGVGRRSGHSVSGLKSNASGASRSRGGCRGGRGRPGPVGL